MNPWLNAAAMERKVRPQKEQALNCPRCHSTNTKFCYYNNYSLTQPRYLCKTCKRYWTQGGTLRNVPVGGGSRKKKKSTLLLSSQKLPHNLMINPSPTINNNSHFSELVHDQGHLGFQAPHEYYHHHHHHQFPKIESRDHHVLSSSSVSSSTPPLSALNFLNGIATMNYFINPMAPIISTSSTTLETNNALFTSVGTIFPVFQECKPTPINVFSNSADNDHHQPHVQESINYNGSNLMFNLGGGGGTKSRHSSISTNTSTDHHHHYQAAGNKGQENSSNGLINLE